MERGEHALAFCLCDALLLEAPVQHLGGCNPCHKHSPDIPTLPHPCVSQERYSCPVYLHTHIFGGRVSNKAADVEDCLFVLQLPSGRYCPTHWITRNVVMLVAPSSLRE